MAEGTAQISMGKKAEKTSHSMVSVSTETIQNNFWLPFTQESYAANSFSLIHIYLLHTNHSTNELWFSLGFKQLNKILVNFFICSFLSVIYCWPKAKMFAFGFETT